MTAIQMKEVTCETMMISGLSVRTNNANEMNPETAKIGVLHGAFNQQVTVNYESGAHLFGVYHGYESDHNGDYSILVGSEKSALKTTSELENELESVTIVASNYLVFSATGGMPQAVIDVWGEVWRYFSDDTVEHTRTFTTDFERYTSANSVDVYIAIL